MSDTVRVEGIHYTSAWCVERIANEGFRRDLQQGEYWGPGVYACLPEAIDTRIAYMRLAVGRAKYAYLEAVAGRYAFEKYDALMLVAPPEVHKLAAVYIAVEVPEAHVHWTGLDNHAGGIPWKDEMKEVLVCTEEGHKHNIMDGGQFVVHKTELVQVLGWEVVEDE